MRSHSKQQIVLTHHLFFTSILNNQTKIEPPHQKNQHYAFAKRKVQLLNN